MELSPPHGIGTQTSPLHIEVAESMQSADEEHVVTTAAVATMVFPVKGMVKNIAVGSSTGAADTYVVCDGPKVVEVNLGQSNATVNDGNGPCIWIASDLDLEVLVSPRKESSCTTWKCTGVLNQR